MFARKSAWTAHRLCRRICSRSLSNESGPRMPIREKTDYKVIQLLPSLDALKFPIWKSMAFTAICASGLLYYFNQEREKMEAKRKLESAGVVGAPKIGGPFKLTDQDGNIFDSKNVKNKYMLLYFGFTHCPDICPEELDKITAALNIIDKEPTNVKLLPVFISVDPERDSPAIIKDYLKDFHPSFVGLTGSKEEIKNVAKQFRVYYRPARTSSEVSGRDYLVDHSIFYFLVDPDGNYVTHFGRESTPERIANTIKDAMYAWDLSN